MSWLQKRLDRARGFLTDLENVSNDANAVCGTLKIFGEVLNQKEKVGNQLILEMFSFKIQFLGNCSMTPGPQTKPNLNVSWDNLTQLDQVN